MKRRDWRDSVFPVLFAVLGLSPTSLQSLFTNDQQADFQNEVVADPHIMCEEKNVGIAITTQKPYFGRMFVNGLSDQPDCERHFNSQYTAGRFEIPMGRCDMRIQRIVQPRPGIEYTTTMVVSFHDQLLTRSDRAFHIKCQYFQSDRSIGSFFEVSMMPTVMLTSSFPMPGCRYTLHVEGVDGPEAQFAKIGDPVYHKWECDSDMYGIKVKSCFVDDGRKRRYQLIDNSGCSSDQVILPDITYDQSLRQAFVQTHVFKFADRAHVFFQCQISLCLKEGNGCKGTTPPACRANATSSTISRQRRFVTTSPNDSVSSMPAVSAAGAYGEMDIASGSLVVLDLGDERKFESYVKRTRSDSCAVCLPSYGFGALIGCNIVTLAIATVTVLALVRRPQVRQESNENSARSLHSYKSRW